MRQHGGMWKFGVAAACVWASLTGAALAQPVAVMQGLDNPRGLAFGPEGALYVAEAGRGGDGPCGTNGNGVTACVGDTGAISRLWQGQQSRLVSGLTSSAPASGADASGPQDISCLDRGGSCVTFGLAGGPATARPSATKALRSAPWCECPRAVASGAFLSGPGRVLRVPPNGGVPEPVIIGLNRPTSVAIGPDGAVYVTNNGGSPGIGEVLRAQ